MIAAGPLRPLVIQPTPFCNIDCSYCYLGNRSDRSRMTLDTIDAIARRIVASPYAAEGVSVVWHAGEPTVVPPDWYEQAFVRLRAAARGALRHSFQTNGILIDERWIDLWRRWDVRVGVSVDGPADLHDAHRRTRAGRGTFDLTVAGLRRLRSAGLPFHVITVLTREALDRPDDLLAFYCAEGVDYVCFNVEEREGTNAASSLDGPDPAPLYRAFLARFAGRLRTERPGLRCREIDAVVGLAAAPPEMRRHNPQVRPLEIVSVAWDGGISTFSPELLGQPHPDYADFVFGDVRTDDLDDVLRHPAFRRLSADVEAGVAACRETCAYFGVCGGGAPANKLAELRDVRGTETAFCRLTRKAVIDAVLPELEAEHVR